MISLEDCVGLSGLTEEEVLAITPAGILRGWPLNRFPGLIHRSAQLIRKYGIASVFMARFTAVVRAFVPLLAGILKMSSRHFYVANILSALEWAPMHVFPRSIGRPSNRLRRCERTGT
jgi:membrane protein DedA with SNARE-associated domain